MRSKIITIVVIIISITMLSEFSFAKSKLEKYKDAVILGKKIDTCCYRCLGSEDNYVRELNNKFSSLDKDEILQALMEVGVMSPHYHYKPDIQMCVNDIKEMIKILESMNLPTQKFKDKLKNLNDSEKFTHDIYAFLRADMCLTKITGRDYPAYTDIYNNFLSHEYVVGIMWKNEVDNIKKKIYEEFENKSVDCKKYLQSGIEFLDKSKFSTIPLENALEYYSKRVDYISADRAQKLWPIEPGLYYPDNSSEKKEILILPYGKGGFIENEEFKPFSWNSSEGKLTIILDDAELPDHEKKISGTTLHGKFKINDKDYISRKIGGPRTDVFTFVEPGMTGFAVDDGTRLIIYTTNPKNGAECFVKLNQVMSASEGGRDDVVGGIYKDESDTENILFGRNRNGFSLDNVIYLLREEKLSDYCGNGADFGGKYAPINKYWLNMP